MKRRAASKSPLSRKKPHVDADIARETNDRNLSEMAVQESKAPPISRVKRENIGAIRRFFEAIGLESLVSSFLTQYDMAETYSNITENDLRELFNVPGDPKPMPSKASLTKGQLKLLEKYILNKSESPIKLSSAAREAPSALTVQDATVKVQALLQRRIRKKEATVSYCPPLSALNLHR